MVSVDYDQQHNYWEGINAKRRSPKHPVVQRFAAPKLKYVLDVLPRRDEPYTMLEVGAGNGFLSVPFDRAFELTCLDFSPNMLAMNPMPSDRKVVGDAEALPFDDDSFDVVFCANLLHHLEDPTVAVGEMRRVARHHVVLLEPNAANPLMFAFGLVKPAERGLLKFSPDYLRKLGQRVGMSLRASATQGMVLPNATPKSALPLAEALERYCPPLPGFYHIAAFDT